MPRDIVDATVAMLLGAAENSDDDKLGKFQLEVRVGTEAHAGHLLNP